MHQHNIRERIHFFTSFRSFYEHCFPKREAPIFTFSEQKRCSSFPEEPSLHVTTFLSHVPPQQPHQDSGSLFTLQYFGMLMMSLPLVEPVSNPIVFAWTAGARHL